MMLRKAFMTILYLTSIHVILFFLSFGFQPMKPDQGSKFETKRLFCFMCDCHLCQISNSLYAAATCTLVLKHIVSSF